ncbi:MAG: hypothetical protein WB586_01060 [Chthoniobacterales bacterium]
MDIRIFQASNRAFQVNRVPKNDDSHHQVDAAGPVTLVLEAAIAEVLDETEDMAELLRNIEQLSYESDDSDGEDR